MSAGMSVLLAVVLTEVVQSSAATADPVDLSDGAQILERADDAEALMTAYLTGKPVRIADLTSETSESFALPSGQVETTVSAGAVRMRRNGGWVPVDLNLRQDADGSVAPVAHPADLSLSGQRSTASTELASVGTETGRISLGWQGALPVPVLDANRATYPEVLPDVDLVVEATRTGLEQFLVLKSRDAVSSVEKLSLPLTAVGMSAVEEAKDGSFDVTDKAGHLLGTMPTPLMWDAQLSANGETPSRLAQVDIQAGAVSLAVTNEPKRSTLAPTGAPAAVAGQVALTLSPSEAWLTDPATRFPVTIDPQINKLLTTFDTTVVEGQTTDAGGADFLRLGVMSGDKPKRARSFVRWDSTELRHKKISEARAYFFNWYSTTCSSVPWEIWTTEVPDSETRWANQPKWLKKEATSTETKGFNSSCGDGWVSIDARSFFQSAADANATRASMGLRASNEADKAQWKEFRSRNADNTAQVPYVKVTYTDPPLDANCFEVDDAKWAPIRAEMDNMAEKGDLTRALADTYKCDPRLLDAQIAKDVQKLEQQPPALVELPAPTDFVEVEDPEGEEITVPDEQSAVAGATKKKKAKKKCKSNFFLEYPMGWPATLTATQSINFCYNGKTVSGWSGECTGSANKAARLLYWSFDSCNQNDWINYKLGSHIDGGIHHKTKMNFTNKTPWTYDVSTTLEQWGHYDGTIDQMVDGKLLHR